MTASLETVAKKSARKPSAWKALELHHKRTSKVHLRELFAEDPTRGEPWR